LGPGAHRPRSGPPPRRRVLSAGPAPRSTVVGAPRSPHSPEPRPMPCTTLLIGRRASADGSPLVARTEDSSAGSFDPKRTVVVPPEDQPQTYASVLGGRTLDLPGDPLQYAAIPNALPDEGIWGCAGINAANVAMSATETITSNPRVLGADPLVEHVPAAGEPGTPEHRPEQPGGLGEADFVTLVLPHIRSAREGVQRL